VPYLVRLCRIPVAEYSKPLALQIVCLCRLSSRGVQQAAWPRVRSGFRVSGGCSSAPGSLQQGQSETTCEPDPLKFWANGCPFPCSGQPRGGLRTVSSYSNLKDMKGTTEAIVAGAATPADPVSPGPTAASPSPSSSASSPRGASSNTPNTATMADKENKADDAGADVHEQPPEQPKLSRKPPKSSGVDGVDGGIGGGEDKERSQAPAAPAVGADSTTDSHSKPAVGKKKLQPPPLGSLRRGGPGSAARTPPATGGSSKKLVAAASGGSHARLGKHHAGGGRGKEHARGGETPEKHVARNLQIFEQNLAGLSLPKGVTGKGAGDGRCV